MSYLVKQLVLPTVALFLLAACQTTDSGSKKSETAFTPITSAVAFEGGVVGKKLIHSSKDNNSIVIAANHTWTGTWSGKEIGGNWMFQDGFFCRTINEGKDDCHLYEMSNKFDQLQVTPKKGSGTSWQFNIAPN